MDKPKRPQGRPPAPPEQTLRIGSIRLTAAQWTKLAALGGAKWIRERIDRAKLPQSALGHIPLHARVDQRPEVPVRRNSAF